MHRIDHLGGQRLGLGPHSRVHDGAELSRSSVVETGHRAAPTKQKNTLGGDGTPGRRRCHVGITLASFVQAIHFTSIYDPSCYLLLTRGYLSLLYFDTWPSQVQLFEELQGRGHTNAPW